MVLFLLSGTSRCLKRFSVCSMRGFPVVVWQFFRKEMEVPTKSCCCPPLVFPGLLVVPQRIHCCIPATTNIWSAGIPSRGGGHVSPIMASISMFQTPVLVDVYAHLFSPQMPHMTFQFFSGAQRESKYPKTILSLDETPTNRGVN